MWDAYVHVENEVEFTSSANDDGPEECSRADNIAIIFVLHSYVPAVSTLVRLDFSLDFGL